MSEYRKQAGATLDRDSRGVVSYQTVGPDGAPVPAAIFRCPCGERTVKVTSPPHGIRFDEAGRLTLDGSVGSRANEHPSNWCHFHVEAGVPTMCADAQCPGRNL